MGSNSSISWTTHTFNMWWGCSFVGGDPACAPPEGKPGAVCYAKTWAERTGYSETGSKFPIWGADSARRYFGDKHWNEPLKWNAAAQKAGVRARVFCMSMGDWAEGRPDQAEHLLRLWDIVLATPWLDWLMLTKRPQLINKLCPIRSLNIWHGCTAVTQKWLDIRWAHLKLVQSEIYWFSMEPLMERVILPADFLALGRRAWVIAGGQSGRHAVPMHPDWVRSLRDQCVDAGVNYHFKQWGEFGPWSDNRKPMTDPGRRYIWPDGTVLKFGDSNGGLDFRGSSIMQWGGTTKTGHLLDGMEWREVPTVGASNL